MLPTAGVAVAAGVLVAAAAAGAAGVDPAPAAAAVPVAEVDVAGGTGRYGNSSSLVRERVGLERRWGQVVRVVISTDHLEKANVLRASIVSRSNCRRLVHTCAS